MLRNVLDLKEGELLSYETLEVLGIDSVIIIKNSDQEFAINFCATSSFDEFQSEYKK